jgi:hypothetical protein
MSILETAVIYILIGSVVSMAMFFSQRPQRWALRIVGGVVHLVLWPFFAPFLLGSAVERQDRGGSEDRDRKAETGKVLVEVQLLESLGQVGGIAEELLGPQMESVRRLSRSLRRMDTRLQEMDRLLATPEFDRGQVEKVLVELQETIGTEEDSRIQSVEARLRNIERLHRMRERARREVQEARLKMEEMTSQVLLMQFADPQQAEVAVQLQEIAATIDGLSESLFAL